MRPLPWLALPLVLAAGCVAYNDPCQVVEDPDQTVGYAGADIPITKPYARHANNAIGQLAADAYRALGPATDAVLGVINGGGIRAEGFCVTRDRVRQGPITRGDIHEILLFDNRVVSVDLTADELVRVFSNAVSGLVPVGQPIVSGPGNFLHVSAGTRLVIDCAVPSSAPPPGRVVGLRIGDQVLVGPGAVPADQRFRVSLTDFLINFGGGTSDIIHAVDDDPERHPAVGQIDSDLAERYLREQYGTPEAPLALDRGRIIGFADDPPDPVGETHPHACAVP